MTSFDDLLSQVPIAQIADQLGVDQATATTAVQAALPTLLGGLQANAAQPQGAASLLGALDNHGGLVDGEGAVDLRQVDVGDGEKIVDNVFGDEKNTVISALGAGGGTGGNDLIGKLLPILAPIVLAYVAKQLTGGGGAAAPAPQQTQASGGGLGDLLGGLLGGSSNTGGLGGMIGDALSKNAGGALGSVLGGLLGGKR